VSELPPAQSFLSWFWTPLVVVTAAAGERRSGQIAVSVHGASILPDQPRLTAGLWKNNLTHELVQASGALAVHLLRSDQDELVFGLESGRDVDKLAGLEVAAGAGGVPLLPDCLAIFECRVAGTMDAGDHSVFLADVVHSRTVSAGEPLWWRDLQGRMPARRRAQWDARAAENMRWAREFLHNAQTPSLPVREKGQGIEG
jgi:flavin reductase (DIM6/NTAB) family NADH-FMN oxidoreductase RutF